MKKYFNRARKRLAPLRARFGAHAGEDFPRWQKNLLAAFVINLCLLLAWDAYLSTKPQPSPRTDSLTRKQPAPAEELRLALERVFAGFGISRESIEDRGAIRIVRVPRSVSLARLQQAVLECLRAHAASIQPALRPPHEFSYALNDQTLGTIRLQQELPKAQGKIAIVIDDFGYHDNAAIAKFINLPFSITYAVIPGLPHSQNVAKKLERLHKTMIVHMPMEAMEKQVETNGYELRVGMPAEEIRSRVRKARALLPNAVGMNNHMGSRATQDEALLLALFGELHSANFFFLDSRTIETTKGFTLAKANGLASALNDTFLDSVEDLEAVRKKMWRLAEIAAQRGTAIGIGHPYATTLQALQEIVPELQARGFEFITLDQMLRPALSSQPVLARRNE